MARTAVRFRLPVGVQSSGLPVPSSLRDDGTYTFETDDPTNDLYQLTSWALTHDIQLDGLSVAPPSLEDIYLRLVAAQAEPVA